MMTEPDCDLFCRVIDNYGDIGVCWRLARQLSEEHGWRVRLWVDDVRACSLLTQGTSVEGIEVCAWGADFPAVEPAGVVIEAFACELPEPYLIAMAARARTPVWLNLEYLCVEDWGPGFHLQPSPHPRLPLLKHFFVPGLLPGTGGVLHEAGLAERQTDFDIQAARQRYAGDSAGRWVFLFCYDNPALPMLLDAWANSPTPIHCLISAGKSGEQVAAWLGQALLPEQTVKCGKLSLHALPFVPQQAFDELLWTCDLNLVRGEDSFCRALWADLPFIWHIYPQQDDVHHEKLASFYRHYAAPGTAGQALGAFNALWNGVISPTQEAVNIAWQALDESLPALKRHAQQWRPMLESPGNLAQNLVSFCAKTAN